jgi:hypothetical protein
MARNRPGGRRGAVRGRTQFRLPNGRFAKVDRATGKILSIKADGRPYKGIVIIPAPSTMPRPHATRTNLPAFPRPRRLVQAPGTNIVHLPPVALGDQRQDAA